jgi:hypothetical protein
VFCLCSASVADLIEEELRELTGRRHSSRSNLLPVEVSRLIASNKDLGQAMSRQYGMWPFDGQAQCGHSNTRDTNYNKNQNLKGQLPAFLSEELVLR